MRGKKYLYYFPFLVLFIVELALHWKISLNWGDDIVFYTYSHEQGFSLITWLSERYMTWSSRTAIEAVIMFMVNLPENLWRVFDSAIVVLAAFSITRLFEQKDYREYYSSVICLLILALPYQYMSLAGWIATTLNYMWPLALGVTALYPIRVYVEDGTIRIPEGILYSLCLIFAVSSEQMAAVCLAAFSGYIIYLRWKNKAWFFVKRYRFIAFQFVLSVFGILYIIICPGNGKRSVFETGKWLPEFAGYSIVTKLILGVSETVKSVFVQENTAFFIMTFLLAVLVWYYNKNKMGRIISVVPVLTMLLFTEIRRVFGSQHPFLNLSTVDGLCLILVLGLIPVSFYFLFGLSIDFAVISFIYLLGLATKVIIGFSPTIYASGERTSWCMDALFLVSVAFLLRKWNFADKRITMLLILSFICLSAPGIFTSFMLCTQ